MYTEITNFITIKRSILAWEWYTDNEVKAMFLHCLLRANWKPSKHKGINLERGQFIAGRKKLAFELGFSEQTVRTILNKLKSTNEITIKSTSKYSIVTVCNYDKYQSKESEKKRASTSKSTNKRTDEQPTTNQQLTTDNNNKQEITINNNIPDSTESIVSDKNDANKEPCTMDNEGSQTEFVRLTKKEKQKLIQIYKDNFGEEYRRVMFSAIEALDDWFRMNPVKYKKSKNHLTRLTGKGLEFQMTAETTRKRFKNQQSFNEQLGRKYE